MKNRTFIIAALAAFTLASCNKVETPEAGSAPEARMTFSIAGVQTKAVGTVPGSAVYQSADESKVNNLQVIVFNGGTVDGYASADASTVTVRCTAGARKAYAIVNGPDASSITSESALLALTSTLKNEASNFVMVGDASVTVENGGNYSIDVDRIAAKVVVRKIKNSLSSGKSIIVKRVLVTNVATRFNFGHDTYASAEADFVNKGGYQPSSNLGSFTQDVDLTQNVANGSTYEADHYYYAYPNNYEQKNHAAAWTPKRTMLLIQVEVEGSLYDYPITLPVLESNKMYVIDQVEFTRLGNPDDGNIGGPDEEDPINGISASFSINVIDWTVVTVPNQTI